jgi:hypothetical protein
MVVVRTGFINCEFGNDVLLLFRNQTKSKKEIQIHQDSKSITLHTLQLCGKNHGGTETRRK